MADQPTPLVVIDFPDAPRRVFSSPVAELCARTLSEVGDVIREAERCAQRGQYAAGFISYEAAPAFDRALRVRADGHLPLAWFGIFTDAEAARPSAPAAVAAPEWRLEIGEETYRERVEQIREHIAAGRTYQVNLTARLNARLDSDPWAYYEALRRAQGEGYHAYLELGDTAILSVSPELFFELRGGRIRTRPMKGTRPRGRWVAEDDALAAELASSEKERAENLMIVDLLRSDVGRVAAIGTVVVDALFEVERYRTVHQLTSTISARLRPEVGLYDVLAALFPCGSVTGAPKVSTMQLITELEDSPREVYCGAIGLLEPGGTSTWNVPIRTLWVDRASGQATYGAGGGITYGSQPEAERAELLAKAAVLVERWPEFALLETMRVEPHRVVRLDRHCARLLASARYFGIPVSEHEVRTSLERAAEDVASPMRLRLLVDGRGRVRTELARLDPLVPGRLLLGASPVSSRDRFLYHKTTHREVYEQQLAAMPGAWDVLLWNEREEVTEFTRGNVVVELEGGRWTPPVHCGLLPGTFRAELLESGAVAERVIHVSELARATRIWFINSVREWLPVPLR